MSSVSANKNTSQFVKLTPLTLLCFQVSSLSTNATSWQTCQPCFAVVIDHNGHFIYLEGKRKVKLYRALGTLQLLQSSLCCSPGVIYDINSTPAVFVGTQGAR